MSGPLEGLQVTDLVQGYGGYCGMMLADLGATVTKVEPPEGDFLRGHGPPFVGSDAAAFVAANRSK
ncbi:MAG: CoA transferase, partial [Dehalococcoidia bacterium]